MKNILFICVLCAACFLLESQNGIAAMQDSARLRHSETEAKAYKVRGTVKKIYREEKKITLDHKAIKGYIPAMTMTFPVANLSILDKLSVGSTGKFTLLVYKGLATITGVFAVKPLAAKAVYECPMHPNQTSDKPGKCAVCGMDFEKK